MYQLFHNKYALKYLCFSRFTKNMQIPIVLKYLKTSQRSVQSIPSLCVSLIYLLYFVPRKQMSSSRPALMYLHLSHEKANSDPKYKWKLFIPLSVADRSGTNTRPEADASGNRCTIPEPRHPNYLIEHQGQEVQDEIPVKCSLHIHCYFFV